MAVSGRCPGGSGRSSAGVMAVIIAYDNIPVGDVHGDVVVTRSRELGQLLRAERWPEALPYLFELNDFARGQFPRIRVLISAGKVAIMGALEIDR